MVEQKINIALDTYNDLFSDFDISAFQNRSISLDFKEELESHYLDENLKQLKIIFSIPKKQRNVKNEKIIIKRLKQFFISKQQNYSKRINLRKQKGFNLIIMGFFFITLTFIFELFFTDWLPLYFSNIIMILGWFGIWNGFEKVVEVPPEFLTKKNMYISFSKAEIIFIDEEDIKI